MNKVTVYIMFSPKAKLYLDKRTKKDKQCIAVDLVQFEGGGCAEYEGTMNYRDWMVAKIGVTVDDPSSIRYEPPVDSSDHSPKYDLQAMDGEFEGMDEKAFCTFCELMKKQDANAVMKFT